MSNFLKNLAKRSAGVPLATECVPATSPAFADDSGSGAELDEIALEPPENFGPDTHTASLSAQSINVASTSPNQIQRDVVRERSTGVRPKQPITSIKSSSEDALSPGVAYVSAAQPEAASDPGKTLDLQPAFESQDRNADLRSGPTIQQTIVVRRETTDVENNLRPMLLTRDGQTFVPPQGSTESTEARTPETRIAIADQPIRPVLRDRPISLQFPKVADAPSPTAAPVPIHVRVGRIEVRGNAPQQTSNVMSKQPAPLGFAAYQRLRRYRI